MGLLGSGLQPHGRARITCRVGRHRAWPDGVSGCDARSHSCLMVSAPTVPPQLPTQLNCPFSNDVLGAQSLRRQLEEGNQQTAEVAQ
jgi:hypothetical protein